MTLLFVSFILTGCTDYEAQIEQLNTELEYVKSENGDLIGTLKSKDEEIEKLRTEFEKINIGIEELETAIDKFESENLNDSKHKELSNPFDSSSINVLDTVCGLSLVKTPISSNSCGYEFRGALQVSGDYSHEPEDEFLFQRIEFRPDEESIKFFPKAKSDTRGIWLVLNEYDEISHYFGKVGETGKVTLVIDNYYIDLREIETVNSATLISIVEKEAVEKIEIRE